MYLSICNNGCKKTFPTDRGDCPHCGIQAALCDTAPVDDSYYGYDIETFPNIFTCRFTHVNSGQKWKFEISDRVNQAYEFVEFCKALGKYGHKGVGYNNIGFDYPVVHQIIKNPSLTYREIYDIAMTIIKDKQNWDYNVWSNDWVFYQIDLLKVHHFDNVAKATSLKYLEMCMGLPNVGDLPFPVGTVLDDAQKDVLLEYNDADVDATCMFLVRSLDMLELRVKMSEKFGMDFTNCSDVKMGEMILIHEMEKHGIQCYEKIGGRKTKRQTHRDSIPLKDVIFDYVKFERPEFQELKDLIESRTITKVDEVLKTKGLLKGVHAFVDGVEYKIGTGGIHASVSSCSIYSTDDMQIVDVDVEGFYPSLAGANRYYPAHLGVEFCDAYDGIGELRAMHPKKTHPMENGAFKLARNGAYGNSNNKYSPLYDPKYTMITTINGQLLLCMLVEQVLKIPGLKMIQANTDGITYQCPVEYLEYSREICKWWEQITCLKLEEVLYDAMFIRDVNSYMAIKKGDKSVKRIGCYAHETAEQKSGTRELPYNKDWSQRIVALAAEAALVRGEDIETFIKTHGEAKDFMIRGKVPRSNQQFIRYDELEYDMPVQNIIRYFVSNTGGTLMKSAPLKGKAGTWKRTPSKKITDKFFNMVLAEIRADVNHTGERDIDGTPHDDRIFTKGKGKHDVNESNLRKGWLVTDCSHIEDFDWNNLNYEYYIAETKKIVDPLVNKV